MGVGVGAGSGAAGADPKDLRIGHADRTPAIRIATSNYLQQIRSEFFELAPKETTKTIKFEEASDGLPQSGSWRNGLTVADMNGDGFPDIIAPPERAGGTGAPAIFLGDGKGHWHYWQQAMWEHTLDYGSVVAADFNKDGHMDLAFSPSISRASSSSSATARETSPTSRKDCRAISRRGVSSSPMSTGMAIPIWSRSAKVRRRFRTRSGRSARSASTTTARRGTEWEGVDVAGPKMRVGGDYLTVGNFNGDKYPDVAGGSIYMGSPDIIYLSKGPKKWSVLDSKEGTVVPMLSYYSASAAGKFTSKKRDDLIQSYVRYWPADVNPKLIPAPPAKEITGIDRISFAADGTATRTPIVRWPTKFAVNGLAVADIDGDGNLDIVYTTAKSAESREIGILLGDGKGNFVKAKTEGLRADRKVTYDVKMADVNGDGRPDIIMMYEADQATALSPRDGAIRVFLNRGPAPASHVADR